ncbi:hypothetical protein [Clostridium paridis]|uniref:DUF3784 domain-containing protein n=1 Tax=Clostridium paridis TaxID=2803863 RepID=A0A937FAI8_9CLOT|nr:hypothetical protein [Clostridium paridis]MBL4930384.1 hypothetical protein [Clostridium paridis]
MNWLGMILIGLGLIYLLYSLLNKSKINYYFKGYIKRNEMKIIKPIEYFKLQLSFSIFNALVFIACGVLISIFAPNDIFFIVALVPFHFINLLLMIESKKRGYIDYKAYKTYKS